VTPLDQIAPAFVGMAHAIVWASVATVDADGKPRSRILHPIWEWDGTDLFGWVATVPTSLKRAHLAVHPDVSVSPTPRLPSSYNRAPPAHSAGPEGAELEQPR